MKIVKNVAALFASLIVWFFCFEIIWLVVGYVGSIPFIGPILYLGDVGWAQSVLSSTSAVFCGAMVSVKICKNAKLFCWIVIAFSAFFVVYLLINPPISLSLIIFFVSGMMTAGICLEAKDEK